MISKKLKFSVITTVKDSEQYIEQTILSVINQTAITNNIIDYEYIIIDSASRDKTIDIINKYSKINDKIFFVSEKDSGMYEGLVKGFKKSTGDIQCYINSGDYFNLNSFSLVEEIFNENSQIKWLTGAKVLYNDKSQIMNYFIPYKYRNSLIQVGAYGKNLPFIQQESTFWKRELIKNLDLNYLKNLKKSGDLYLWFEFSKSEKLYVINSHLSGFKYHKNQLTFRETGTTSNYINEAKSFLKKKKFYHYILIVLDMPFWYISKYITNILCFRNKNLITFDIKLNNWKISNSAQSKKISCWVCNFSSNQGEGKLANNFANDLMKQNYGNVTIFSLNGNFNYNFNTNKFNNYKSNNFSENFFQKYINPIIGILYLWFKYLTGNKTCYINYTPLWNFLLFIFLPPKTILGPITGGVNIKSDTYFDGLFRKYLMFYFYYLSIFFLKLRNHPIIFASSNLYSIISESSINSKSTFNYVYTEIQNHQKTNVDFEKREYDFCIYYRDHPTKNQIFFKKIIHFLLTKNFKIIVFGNHIKKSRVGNFTSKGIVTSDEVNEILSKTKFSLLSSENVNSFFAMSNIINQVHIIYSKDINNNTYIEKDFHQTNYEDIEQSQKDIIHYFNTINKLPVYDLSKLKPDIEKFFLYWKEK